MRRPPVSVVMPFAGDRAAADAALRALRGLALCPGDELILADNAGTAVAGPGVSVIRASGERSPAHARNVGARRASNDWILFVDADCRAPADLLDAYFALPVADDVGALVGDVRPAPGAATLVARYGAARSFLAARPHLSHPYRPRAAAANLLVRRTAFGAVGGFLEGLRAAEDTDFSWRLQEAGWRLELRGQAVVEHQYRTGLRQLRRQWRGYAAGRAWLARRYKGFTPQPAVARALRRRASGTGRSSAVRAPPGDPSSSTGRRASGLSPAPESSRRERLAFLVLDGILGIEELVGLTLSNRPAPLPAGGPTTAVLVAERFPAQGDPLVELARQVAGARVEAARRPRALDTEAAAELTIAYREDDGAGARAAAVASLLARHPLRCLHDARRRAPGSPSLWALGPAVARVARHPEARLFGLGGEPARAIAVRMAALAGRSLEPPSADDHADGLPGADGSADGLPGADDHADGLPGADDHADGVPGSDRHVPGDPGSGRPAPGPG